MRTRRTLLSVIGSASTAMIAGCTGKTNTSSQDSQNNQQQKENTSQQKENTSQQKENTSQEDQLNEYGSKTRELVDDVFLLDHRFIKWGSNDMAMAYVVENKRDEIIDTLSVTLHLYQGEEQVDNGKGKIYDLLGGEKREVGGDDISEVAYVAGITPEKVDELITSYEITLMVDEGPESDREYGSVEFSQNQ